MRGGSSTRARLALLCLCAPVVVGAQGSALRVSIVDTAGAPLRDVQVSVLRGLRDTVGRGVTDERGSRIFTVRADSADLEVVARRIGFVRASRFTSALGRGEINVVLMLAPAPQGIAPVVIRERENPVHAAYFIDAEAIEHSARTLLDAEDIVRKLRPDMILGHQGRGTAIVGRICAPMSNLYVNGRWIMDAGRLPAVRPLTSASSAAHPVGAMSNAVGMPPIPTLADNDPMKPIGDLAMELRLMKPEHILEMQYRDCLDSTATSPLTMNALYVTLKAGVVYERGLETYVADGAPPPRRKSVRERARLLIVVDVETDKPVDGAEVMELRTGLGLPTDVGGRLPLAHLPDGLNPVRIRKAGYADRTLPVIVSPRDTANVIVGLSRRP